MTTSVPARSLATLNTARQQLDELDALLQRMLELPVNKLDDAEQEAVEEPPSAIDSSLGEGGQRTADSGQRPASSPHSYMVVETASPRPFPPASGFEPRPSSLQPPLTLAMPPKVENREAPAPQEQQKTDETPPPHLETPEPKSDEETWVPLRSTWQPSAQTWQPLAESWQQAHSEQPIPSSSPEQSPPLTDKASLAPVEAPSRSPELSPPSTDTAAVESAAAAKSSLNLSPEDAPPTVPILLLPLLWFNQGFDACLTPLGSLGRLLCGSGGRRMLGLVGLTCLAAAVAIVVSAGMGWTW